MRKIIIKYFTQIKNFSALSILNFANYIISFITFPYIVRTIGVENFGLLSFASAFINYFGLFIDFGFSFSAPQIISINRKNKNDLNKNYSAVLLIRIILIAVSLLLISIILLSVNYFRADITVYYLTFIAVAFDLLFPYWFFQGIEQMTYISKITIIFKVFAAAAIFLLVKFEDDYLILLGINAITNLFIALCAIYVIKVKFGINFILPSIKDLKYYLFYSKDYFFSNIGISLYTNSNTFILGLFSSNTVVGYWAAADKIRYALITVYGTFSQTIFPYFAKTFKEDFKSAIKQLKNIIKYGGIFTFVVSLLLFLLAPNICSVILGNNYSNSVLLLRIISWLPFLIFLSNLFGIQLMFNIGLQKVFVKIIFVTAALHLIISFVLVPVYFAVGTAIALNVTEIFITLSTYFYLKRKIIL